MSRPKVDFLYVHSFEWKVDFGFSKVKPGLYPAVDRDNFYMVELNKFGGFILDKEKMVGDHDAWDCDIEVVTVENLLDLPIKRDELDLMINYEPVSFVDPPGQDEEDSIVEELDISLEGLAENDFEAFEALVKTMTMIAESLHDNGQYVPVTDDLVKHPATARIASCTKAAYQIESYLNTSNGNDMSGLFSAIYTLMAEAVRQHKRLKRQQEIE